MDTYQDVRQDTEKLPSGISPSITPRAVIYLRVSSEGQLDGFGPEVQLSACQRYAVTHGLDVVAVFSDVVSGKTDMEDRERLLDALQLIEDNGADRLLTYRLDRIARDLFVQEAILARVWQWEGCEVHTAEDGEIKENDPDAPGRNFIRKLLGLVAELDRELIVKRLRDGRAAKARRGGRPIGRYPYGWTKGVDGPVQIPEEQEVIAEIQRRRAGSPKQTLEQIAAALNGAGKRQRNGNHWSIGSVQAIAARPNEPWTIKVYTERLPGKTAKKQRPRRPQPDADPK